MSDLQKIKNVTTNFDFTNLSKSTNSLQSNSENFSNKIKNFIGETVEEISLLSSNDFKNINYENIEKDGFTPQGVTTIDNRLLISAYKKGELSRIYIYNSTTKEYEGKLILDNDAHVGGITYDKENKILFITGSNGSVNAYNYELIEKTINELISDFSFNDGYLVEFSNSNSADAYNLINNTTIGEYSFKIDTDININYNNKIDNSKAATVYYYDGRIYIGSFEGMSSGRLVSYELDYDKENNSITASNIRETSIPPITQGIAVTEYNNNEYLITSQSVGFAPSSITIFEKKTNQDMKASILFLEEKGIEGIKIEDSGEVIAIFENGRTEVLSTNIEKLKNSANKTIEGNDIAALISQLIGGYRYEEKHK